METEYDESTHYYGVKYYGNQPLGEPKYYGNQLVWQPNYYGEFWDHPNSLVDEFIN